MKKAVVIGLGLIGGSMAFVRLAKSDAQMWCPIFLLETDQVQGIAEDIRQANYIRKILK